MDVDESEDKQLMETLEARHVLWQISFKQPCTSVQLLRQQQRFLIAEIVDINLSLVLMTQSVSFGISLKDLSARHSNSSLARESPVIHRSEESSKAFFDVSILHESSTTIRVGLEPLDVILDPLLAGQLSRFFAAPASSDTRALDGASNAVAQAAKQGVDALKRYVFYVYPRIHFSNAIDTETRRLLWKISKTADRRLL